jgi:signal transduction histidine kinase
MSQSAPSERDDTGASPRKAPSLRARLRLAVMGGAILFIVQAATLGAMTRLLGDDVRNMKEAIESALVTRSIELDLVRHVRADGTWPGGAPAMPPDEIASRLRGSIADARRYINSAAEAALIDELGQHVEAYLTAHRERSERGGGDGRARDALDQELATTLALAERLVALNDEQANRIVAQETVWYRTAILVNAFTTVVLGLGLGLALFGFNRWVRKPLASVASAIARYGAGDRASRADEVGPPEIREIAETFNDMAATLARQERDRIAFVGGVAHDLRGPVTAIQLASVMLDPNGPSRGERSEDMRAILARQAAQLERMIGDFLDAVRIHAGHLDIQSEPVDLVKLMRESVAQYRPIATDHELVASAPAGAVTVAGDAMRLGQVLTNLLSNAVKYSPKGGLVKITLSAERSTATLAVSDQGIGIQPDEYKHIFDPFRRTAASRELVPGVGLGLSVAKRIVEAHGGRLEVASTPGRGSTFRVHLPLTP